MRKKLIEVALPLDAINAASARETSSRHGHPSTLHLWWARRPLAGRACGDLRATRPRAGNRCQQLAQRGRALAGGRRARGELGAVRALVAPGPRVDRVLAALAGGVLPAVVHAILRRVLQQALASGSEAVEKALDRTAMAVALPWRTHAPARFDPVHLRQALDRSHGGLDRVKSRLVEVLAASRRTGGLLTVEAPPRSGGGEDAGSALLVCPRTLRAPVRIACLAGPGGTGKTSLAVAAAGALGRTVHVTLGEDDTSVLIRGREDDAPGCILVGLREAGVRNPVFLLEAIDRAGPDAVEALLDVLDPKRCLTFRDQYVRVPFDLSAVLWIVTATDPDAVPEAVRNRLEVIELPGYTEQEKLAIAERHLLKRPFDASVPGPAAWLAPEPAAPSPAAGPDGPVPIVVVEREVSSPAELEALSAGAPCFGAPAEAWRTAASAGVVRFERSSVREVICGHTEEAGVTELNAKLAWVCRQALAHRPRGARGRRWSRRPSCGRC